MKTVDVEGKFLQDLIVSDEAIFSLNSEANSSHVVQCAKRGKGYPNDHYVDFDPGEDKATVWMGLPGVVNFVDGGMDTRHYLRIERNSVVQIDFRRRNINRMEAWRQQDGASCHTSNQSIRYLRGQFPGKLISKKGDHHSPPHSPDLAKCNFFSWGF